MPAFKEHGAFVNPSDLVAGRRYLMKHKQGEIPQSICIFSHNLPDQNESIMRVVYHARFPKWRRLAFHWDYINFYDLDEVMEEEI